MPLGKTGDGLRAFASGQTLSAKEICHLSHAFTQLHVDMIQHFTTPIDLVSVHGQTLYHAPPFSWQMIDISAIAQHTGLNIIGDLRTSDLAAGGQGAPISPLADHIMYRSSEENRLVVNLGGFCNVTYLPKSCDLHDIDGWDVCPCNHLLDGLARLHLKQPYDHDGATALKGNPSDNLVQHLQQQLSFPKGASLGQDHFPNIAPTTATGARVADHLNSATLAIVRTIEKAISNVPIDRILMAGGGWNNLSLQQHWKHNITTPTESCDRYGPSSTYREAAIMAILGELAHQGYPITLPQITGRPTLNTCGLQSISQHSS
jgi:1,6-anhydro-N-acetylmuramate kinase